MPSWFKFVTCQAQSIQHESQQRLEAVRGQMEDAFLGDFELDQAERLADSCVCYFIEASAKIDKSGDV